jgi:hypothetical protein
MSSDNAMLLCFEVLLLAGVGTEPREVYTLIKTALGRLERSSSTLREPMEVRQPYITLIASTGAYLSRGSRNRHHGVC